MVKKVSIEGIVSTSIVTAFTIAAALIWKDVIVEIIEIFFPSSEIIYYKFGAAIIATILVVIAIYVMLKTEEETEGILRRFRISKM